MGLGMELIAAILGVTFVWLIIGYIILNVSE
jgi:hypothetical protein